MTSLGIDRSHWNAEPDFGVFKQHGGTFVLCKGTDGAGGKDPTFEPCRAGTEAAGLVFGGYHFAQWGNVTAEANWFLSQTKPRPGELIALDAEANIPAGVDVVAWTLAWSRIVHGAVGAWPLLYMNQAWLSGHDWHAVAGAGDGLWLAKYDGLPTGGPLGAWPVLAMKQYTSTGAFPGQPGQIDEDAFQGDLSTLLKYAVPATTPAPVPVPAPSPPPAPAPEVELLPDERAALLRIDAAVSQVGDGPVGLHALQARDASTDADNRAGFILTAVQTQIVPQIEQLQTLVKAQGDTIVALGQLLAQGNGLTPADVLAQVDAALAKHVQVDVTVHGDNPATPAQ